MAATAKKKKPAPTRKPKSWDDVPPLPHDAKVSYCLDQVRLAIGGLSRRHLRAIIASGEFPRADWLIGRLPRWYRETVEKWQAAQKPGGEPDGLG